MTQVESPLEMWNSNYPFNKNRYILRLTDKEFKQSSKGNPMIEMGWEIVGAGGDGSKQTASIIVDPITKLRKDMVVIGLKAQFWLTLTDNNMARVREWHSKMKLQVSEPNPESPDLSIYDGIIANAIVGCRESEELSDDVDTATGLRIPIKDDNGKPIKKYYLSISDFISRNTTFVPTNPL